MTADVGRARVAWGAAGLCAVLLGIAVAGVAVAGMSLSEVLNGYVVTNAVMALSFASCGVVLATRRPANLVGWAFLGAGLAHVITAASVPLLAAGLDSGRPGWELRSTATLAAYAWPWSIGLLLPLALLLFPDGRPPGPRWRPVVWAEIVTAPVFVLEMGTDPGSLVDGAPPGYLTLKDHAHLMPLWTAAELRTLLCFGAGVAALIVRYRRGGERERRQLLWLIPATLITVAVLIPWGLFLSGPVLMLLAIPLIGVAVTVAILRYQLLDIRLVISRTVLYLLLTAGVVAAYIALVAAGDLMLRQGAGLGTSAFATVLIAVGFNPLRVRLQRLVDRTLYGDRADPVRAASQVGALLTGADGELGGVLEALRAALRLPFASLRGPDGEICAVGSAPRTLHVVPLTYNARRVGELIIGVRSGDRGIGAADRAVLELLAAPLSVAVFATTLSQELQRSRERIVTAREEERRRLRRDLHDGLGPKLTAVTLQADLARNLVPLDPEKAVELLGGLRREVGTAIEDIRRVAYGLRPPALDELGLIGALRQQIAQLGVQTDGPPVTIAVDLPETAPALSAAVEAAAYLITIEGLTNALRHARARNIDVRLVVDHGLSILVRDDGVAANGGWSAGVGLRSMRERAAELGGTCDAGPTAGGGLVEVRLPLWPAYEGTGSS